MGLPKCLVLFICRHCLHAFRLCITLCLLTVIQPSWNLEFWFLSNNREKNGLQTANDFCLLFNRSQNLRGPTPFEDMIFYLWTDSNEICTAYVKFKINHILFVKNFWFSIYFVFWENYDFLVFWGVFFG